MGDAGAGVKKKVKTWDVIDLQNVQVGERAHDATGTEKLKSHLDSLQHRPALRTTDAQQAPAHSIPAGRRRHDPANESAAFKRSAAGGEGVRWLDGDSPARPAVRHHRPSTRSETPPPPDNAKYAAARPRAASSRGIHEKLYNRNVACRANRVELIDDYEKTFDNRLRSYRPMSPGRRGFVAGGKGGWQQHPKPKKGPSSGERRTQSSGVLERLAQPKRRKEALTERGERPTARAAELTGSTFVGARYGKITLKMPTREKSPPAQGDAGRRLYDAWVLRKKQTQEEEEARRQPSSAPHRSGSHPPACERLYEYAKEVEERRQARARRKEVEEEAKLKQWLTEGQAARPRTLFRPKQPRPHRPWHSPPAGDYSPEYYPPHSHTSSDYIQAQPPAAAPPQRLSNAGPDEGVGVLRSESYVSGSAERIPHATVLDHMTAPQYEGEDTYMLDNLTHSARERRRQASQSVESYQEQASQTCEEPRANSPSEFDVSNASAGELPPSYDHATTTEFLDGTLPTAPPVLGHRDGSGRTLRDSTGSHGGTPQEAELPEKPASPVLERKPSSFGMEDLSASKLAQEEEQEKAQKNTAERVASFHKLPVRERTNSWEKHMAELERKKSAQTAGSGADAAKPATPAADAKRSPDVKNLSNLTWTTTTSSSSCSREAPTKNASFEKRASNSRTSAGSNPQKVPSLPVAPKDPAPARPSTKFNAPDDSGSDLAEDWY